MMETYGKCNNKWNQKRINSVYNSLQKKEAKEDNILSLFDDSTLWLSLPQNVKYSQTCI